jgi:hypothetical protein
MPYRHLRAVTNLAAFLLLAATRVKQILALTVMLLVASASFAQEAVPATSLSDAQSQPSTTADQAPPDRAATRGASDSSPKWGIFAGYSSIETNNHNFHFAPHITAFALDYDENGYGFNIGGVRNLNRYFGIVGLFDAHFSSNHFVLDFVPGHCSQPPCAKVPQGTDINPSLFRFTAGPEVAFRNRTRVTPFADALFGLAHSHATFGTAGSAGRFSATEGENGFAVNFAVGLEVRVAHGFSFRGSIDYGKAFVGSSALPSQLVDSIGFSSGLLFRFH